MIKILKYCSLIVLLFCFACANEDEVPENVEDELKSAIEELGIPSIVTGIVDSSGLTWQGAYGFANIEYNIPATEQTMYCLQSISKLFLSICAFQLYEEGKLDPEADINTYLPFTVRNPFYPDSTISVSMLLNHSSGLAWPADHEDIPDFHHFYIDEEPVLIRDWIPEYILPTGDHYRDYVWKDFPPGEKFLYSNIGTSLLGLVIEEVSEMDYRNYCRQHIFDPLGMDQTTLYLSELDYNLIATPYYDIYSPTWYYSCRHYPAGFIHSNLIDFARFVQACLHFGELDGIRILKKETFQRMIEIENEQAGIANLWDTYTDGGIGHIGGGTGFSTVVEWHLDNNYAFSILSNRENSEVYHFGRIYELVKYQAVHGH